MKLKHAGLLAAGLILAITMPCVSGCAPPREPGPELDTMKGVYPPEDLYARLEETPPDVLVTLFSRADMALEKEALRGGHDSRISGDVLYELERRYGENVMAALPAAQRRPMRDAVRRFVSDERYLGGEPLWLFAARYDGDYVMDLLEDKPEWAKFSLDRTVRCLVLAGNQQRAWNLLSGYATWMPELQLCGLIMSLGDNRLAPAADFVYDKTYDLRWLVRLSALYALHRLDDPRADAALTRGLGDLRRSPGFLRVLLLDYWSQQMLSQHARQELVAAVTERKIPGAAETLEAIVLNRWEGRSSPRIAAGQALLAFDLERGVPAVRKLLAARDATEQQVGIWMAQGHAEILKPELERLRKDGADEDVRELAEQVLR